MGSLATLSAVQHGLLEDAVQHGLTGDDLYSELEGDENVQGVLVGGDADQGLAGAGSSEKPPGTHPVLQSLLAFANFFQ
jgi:hypothetical protein